jgi:predicted NBD/HSP70 family sugar kinase
VPAARRGRPLTRIDLNPSATNVLAAKISIAGIELALADYRSAIHARYELPLATYDAKPEAYGQQVAGEIEAFLARHQIDRRSVSRIGIAVQGAADSRSGSIMWSPAFRARNIPLVEPVERELGIPCTIANDANMMAEGLDRSSYGGTSAVVFMGYGVGMGLILDGKVYHGPTGAAAEFGHMNHLPHGALCRCGRRGCIEAYAADYAILRGALGESELVPPTMSGVEPEVMAGLQAQARAGEERVRAAYSRAGEALGFGLARLVAVLSPTRIVLGGPGTEAMDLIEPSLRQAFADGVVDELRRNVLIDVVPIDTDMILKGTIDSALRSLDAEVFSSGVGAGAVSLVEESA